MRNRFAIALLCLLSLSLAAGQQAGTAKSQKSETKTEAASSTSNVEDQIKKLEQDWAQAIMNKRSCGGSI